MKIALLNNVVFPYNRLHTLAALSTKLEFTNTNDYSIGLLLDPESFDIPRLIPIVEVAKRQGKRIVYLVYDPYGFRTAFRFIEMGLVDKIVVFDRQYEKRFPIETILTEYVLNESLFPDVALKSQFHFCYFGNLAHGRTLPNNTLHLQTDSTEAGFRKLYQTASSFKGGVVVPTGLSEDGSSIIYHNKGKIAEYLLCGLQPYITNPIESIAYKDYVTFDFNQDPIKIHIPEIKAINRANILSLCERIIQ